MKVGYIMEIKKQKEVIKQLSYRIADLERSLAEEKVDKQYLLKYINQLESKEDEK